MSDEDKGSVNNICQEWDCNKQCESCIDWVCGKEPCILKRQLIPVGG